MAATDTGERKHNRAINGIWQDAPDIDAQAKTGAKCKSMSFNSLCTRLLFGIGVRKAMP